MNLSKSFGALFLAASVTACPLTIQAITADTSATTNASSDVQVAPDELSFRVMVELTTWFDQVLAIQSITFRHDFTAPVQV